MPKNLLTYEVVIIKENLDESLLLKKLILENCLNLHVIAVESSIELGIVALENHNPDIVFMDVIFQNEIIFYHLYKFNLKNIQMIFLSSVSKYAVDAYKVDAADFVMKPLLICNVLSSVEKATIRINNQLNFSDNRSNAPIIINPQINHDFIVVSSLNSVNFLNKEDIIYCTSDGKYTTFFLNNGKNIISCKNLGIYEKLFNSFYFYRIHHSYIVNIKYLVKINKNDGLFCVLKNNISLPIARRKQQDFFNMLKIKV